MKKASLGEISWPDFGPAQQPHDPTTEELEMRIAAVRHRMQQRDLTHLVVYADREHFANLMYLVHFDPRFEEAILILNMDSDPLILVGNECESHLTMSSLFQEKKIRHEVYQPLSLLSQPRDQSRMLKEIFSSEGINRRSKVGTAGWKYFLAGEEPAGRKALEIPSYIVDVLRDLTAYEQVENAADLFMHPADGLRTSCSIHEIARFEFAHIMASEGMKNLLFSIREGITDYELAACYQFTGVPLAFHVGMKCGGNRHIGLSSPSGHTIRRGDPFSTGMGYWGSNVCRAGWIAEDASDLPEAARSYISHFAGPYIEAMGQWFSKLKIGTAGGDLASVIERMLPFEQFGVYLNPGHLIHYDEWVSSPIYKNSTLPLRSGMIIQTDVIPRSPVYFSSRMEDGVVLADESLRSALRHHYPQLYNRCQKRRAFMMEVLGFDLPEEVLPLSNMPAIVPPWMLSPDRVFILS